MKQERMKKTGVHPLVQLLNIDDVDDCDWLEHAAFDPIEAASREKVRLHSLYRPCSQHHHALNAFFFSSTVDQQQTCYNAGLSDPPSRGQVRAASC